MVMFTSIDIVCDIVILRVFMLTVLLYEIKENVGLCMQSLLYCSFLIVFVGLGWRVKTFGWSEWEWESSYSSILRPHVVQRFLFSLIFCL